MKASFGLSDAELKGRCNAYAAAKKKLTQYTKREDKPPDYVPQPVLDYYYNVLLSSKIEYCGLVRACWDALVFHREMKYVYEAFSKKLDPDGWRAFFQAATDCATVDWGRLFDQRGELRAIFVQIDKQATRLADTLDKLSATVNEVDEISGNEINLSPFTSMFALLELTATEPNWCDGPQIVQRLRAFRDLDLDRGLDSPAAQLRALSKHANVIVRMASEPGAQFMPGEEMLAAGLEKRQNTELSVFTRALVARFQSQPELEPMRSMTNDQLSSLATAVLFVNSSVKPQAVKKSKARSKSRP